MGFSPPPLPPPPGPAPGVNGARTVAVDRSAAVAALPTLRSSSDALAFRDAAVAAAVAAAAGPRPGATTGDAPPLLAGGGAAPTRVARGSADTSVLRRREWGTDGGTAGTKATVEGRKA